MGAAGRTQQALIGKILDWTVGARKWVAMAWRANDFAIVANGGTPSVDTNGALPVEPVRLMVGAAPYTAARRSADGNLGSYPIFLGGWPIDGSGFRYFARTAMSIACGASKKGFKGPSALCRRSLDGLPEPAPDCPA